MSSSVTHFISGLPRSGSTLLAGILRQNPRFHAAMSSPVAVLVNALLEQTGAGSEFYPFFHEPRRKAMCRASFRAYYEDQRKCEVLFDTNRLWTARLHQLVEVFDDFKVICRVRNPAWIMDNFERIYRKNPLDYSRMFSAGSRMTVYSRCEALIGAGGAVGGAWTALKEACYGEYSERLLLVDYDILTRHPRRTMESGDVGAADPESAFAELGTEGEHCVGRRRARRLGRRGGLSSERALGTGSGLARPGRRRHALRRLAVGAGFRSRRSAIGRGVYGLRRLSASAAFFDRWLITVELRQYALDPEPVRAIAVGVEWRPARRRPPVPSSRR